MIPCVSVLLWCVRVSERELVSVADRLLDPIGHLGQKIDEFHALIIRIRLITNRRVTINYWWLSLILSAIYFGCRSPIKILARPKFAPSQGASIAGV
jgi:hypothetical protein